MLQYLYRVPKLGYKCFTPYPNVYPPCTVLTRPGTRGQTRCPHDTCAAGTTTRHVYLAVYHTCIPLHAFHTYPDTVRAVHVYRHARLGDTYLDRVLRRGMQNTFPGCLCTRVARLTSLDDLKWLVLGLVACSMSSKTTSRSFPVHQLRSGVYLRR